MFMYTSHEYVTKESLKKEDFKGRNICNKKFSWKKFSRKEIFVNLPPICDNEFLEIYQKFPIHENFFPEINQKYLFAKINSAKNDIFPKKFSGTRIVFYIINGSQSKHIQNH